MINVHPVRINTDPNFHKNGGVEVGPTDFHVVNSRWVGVLQTLLLLILGAQRGRDPRQAGITTATAWEEEPEVQNGKGTCWVVSDTEVTADL